MPVPSSGGPIPTSSSRLFGCMLYYIYIRQGQIPKHRSHPVGQTGTLAVHIYRYKKNQNHPESRRQGRDPKNGWRGTDRIEMYSLYIYTIYVDTKTGHRTTPGINHQPRVRDPKWPWPI